MPSFGVQHTGGNGVFNVSVTREDSPLTGFCLHSRIDYHTHNFMQRLSEADLTAIVLECLPHLSPDRLQQVQLGITMRREQMRAALATDIASARP